MEHRGVIRRQRKIELRGAVHERHDSRQRSLQGGLQIHLHAGIAAGRAKVIQPPHPERRARSETVLSGTGLHGKPPRPLRRTQRGVNGRSAVAEKRGGAGPGRAIVQGAGVAQTGEVHRIGARAVVEAPVGNQIRFVAGKSQVPQREDFRSSEFAIPDAGLINLPAERTEPGILANGHGGGRGGCARGTCPAETVALHAIHKNFPPGVADRVSHMVPLTVGDDPAIQPRIGCIDVADPVAPKIIRIDVAIV